MKKIISCVLAITSIFMLTACGSAANNASNKVTIVKVAVVGENNDQWQPVIDALAKENVTLELVKFSEYSLPNQALADGEVDLNAFQHNIFLENEIKNKGFDLTPIGNTLIAILGLYSDKITSIDQLVEGDKIAIPNDATNGGRALKVIESAGLITLDPATGYLPEVKDITNNPLNLEFIEVDAAQTISLLPDVAAAIINGNYIKDAGRSANDAIYVKPIDLSTDTPYINLIVARTKDKDNELYKKIVKYYQTDEVKAIIDEMYDGSTVAVW